MLGFFFPHLFFSWTFNSKGYLQYISSLPALLHWKHSLMDSLIISIRTVPTLIYVLWVNMSVATSAKWTSIIFSPQPQKWLPWQRHFAIAQYPEIAEYSLYPTAESASPAYGIGAKMFYYLLPFASLRESGVAYTVSSHLSSFTCSLLWEEEQKEKLWFSPRALVPWKWNLQPWWSAGRLIKNDKPLNFVSNKRCWNNCNLPSHFPVWRRELRSPLCRSENEGCRCPALKSSSHRFSLYLSTEHMTFLCCLLRLKTSPCFFVDF